MRDFTCLVILVMCVSHLTAEYFLLETEDKDKVKVKVPVPGTFGEVIFSDGSGDEATDGDESSEEGSDYVDPPPPSNKPTTMDPAFWLRYVK